MNKISFLLSKSGTYLTLVNRVDLLFTVSSLGLLIGILLSSNAWGTARTYPLSPIINGFYLPYFIQTAVLLLVAGCLIVASLYKRTRTYTITLAIFGIFLLILTDITRLQPWVLHYSGVLILFSFIIPIKFKSTTYILDAARIIIGGIYFWSGVQKVNLRFFTEVFPWFTEALWSPWGQSAAAIAIIVGFLVPFIELAFAIGFFSRKFRTLSLLGATSMIVLVLLSIGPAGQNWNTSVWPWNIGIFSSVFILFWATDFGLIEFVRRQKNNLLAWCAFSIFWLMPLGNFVGLTDHYLSWSLYSGKVPEATLIGEQIFLEKLSPSADNGELNYVRWTLQDINLVPYPEKRVFLSVFESICEQYPNQPLILKIDSFLPAQTDYFECSK